MGQHTVTLYNFPSLEVLADQQILDIEHQRSKLDLDAVTYWHRFSHTCAWHLSANPKSLQQKTLCQVLAAAQSTSTGPQQQMLRVKGPDI